MLERFGRQLLRVRCVTLFSCWKVYLCSVLLCFLLPCSVLSRDYSLGLSVYSRAISLTVLKVGSCLEKKTSLFLMHDCSKIIAIH